jgi:hypothetical protein
MENQVILASAPVGPSVFDPSNFDPSKLDLPSLDPQNPDLPVVSVTTDRRFV